MKQKRLLSMLVLLAAVVSGAWATPNSIVINGTPQVGDKSISLTYHFDPANVSGIKDYVPTLKVKCAADNKWDEMNLSLTEVSSGTTTISLNKLVEFEAGKTYEVCFAYYNGNWVDEGFQSFVPAGPATYTITLAEGTEDADKWTVKAGEGEYQALPLEGVAANTAVSVKYNGTKKVKSVKAVKKAAAGPVDNTYQKWDAGQLVKTDIQAEVTTVQNANTDVNWEAGTYVVEGDVTIGGTISLLGDVNLIIKDGAKLTVNSYIYGYSSKNLSIYGQSNQTGELVVNSSWDVIEDVNTLEVHSAKVKVTASGDNCSGFYNIKTFNVYGGSVDSECTGTIGNGILLASSGKMNIYGGDVKALGKGNKFGIAGSLTTVTVYGGKLWAGCFNNKAIDASNVTLKKGDGFTGKIETSGSGESWEDWTVPATPGTNYVRVGY
jgi:hypothetical protein